MDSILTQVSHKCYTSFTEVSHKCQTSVTQVAHKRHTSVTHENRGTDESRVNVIIPKQRLRVGGLIYDVQNMGALGAG